MKTTAGIREYSDQGDSLHSSSSTVPRVGPYVYFRYMNPWRFSNFVVISCTYFAPCMARNRYMNLPLSTLKNGSNLARTLDFVEKIWRFPHPQAAILPLQRLPGGWASPNGGIAACGRGKLSYFFNKIFQIFAEFDPFFWGRKWQIHVPIARAIPWRAK